ncbi:MAG: glycoside hydrolase family 20 zincin-like fold domain-containing protein, partial [Planctomycetota bacterium]
MGPDLLPRPRRLDLAEGVCVVGPDAVIDLQVDDPRLERALLDWRLACIGAARPRVRVVVDGAAVRHRDAYRLAVRPDHIDIVGGSAAGCFHAIQTVRQLSRHGPVAGGVPCCTVIDWPDYTTRGLLHDVTRGKVPTLDTLELLVDRLAELKANQLQLYIEHAFVFSFDPAICGPDEGLTPDEVRELDRYCRDRFIDLVPALATFGHMGRILSMPRYRHLAEVEAIEAWSATTWPERMRGLTLDCMNPEAHRLIGHMWSDILDAFSSSVVNICGDEPHDLGKGRNRDHRTGPRALARAKSPVGGCGAENTESFPTDAIGALYLGQIRRTHDICTARGRRTQFWSDVVRN